MIMLAVRNFESNFFLKVPSHTPFLLGRSILLESVDEYGRDAIEFLTIFRFLRNIRVRTVKV